MTWAEAFLLQACSDYAIFKSLSQSPATPECHRLHYLQMATEKLAKHHACLGTNGPPKKTHAALVSLLRQIPNMPQMRQMMGYSRNPGGFTAYIKSLLPVATLIEELAPVGGELHRLNAEYPWEDGKGTLLCPHAYSYPEFRKMQPQFLKFLKLMDQLFQDAESKSSG
jgi:hypothetical protein